MKTLTEQDIVRIMREEWQKLVTSVCEGNDLAIDTSDAHLSSELKVLHKASGIRYTIDSVGPRDCILRTPEDDKFIVDADTLESDYQLD